MKRLICLLLILFGCQKSYEIKVIKDKNGIVLKEYSAQNGKAIGPYTIFYPSGEVKVQGNWDDSKGNGNAKFLYKTGEVKEILQYKDSLIEGTTWHYFKNGNVKYKAQFKSGERVDVSSLYHKNGQLSEKKWYYADEIAYIEKYDSNGTQLLGVIDPIFSNSSSSKAQSVIGVIGVDYSGELSVDIKTIYLDGNFNFKSLEHSNNEFSINIENNTSEVQVGVTYNPSDKDSINKHRTITSLKIREGQLIREADQQVDWVPNI